MCSVKGFIFFSYLIISKYRLTGAKYYSTEHDSHYDGCTQFINHKGHFMREPYIRLLSLGYITLFHFDLNYMYLCMSYVVFHDSINIIVLNYYSLWGFVPGFVCEDNFIFTTKWFQLNSFYMFKGVLHPTLKISIMFCVQSQNYHFFDK